MGLFGEMGERLGLGFRFLVFWFRDVTPVLQNQMERTIENDAES